MAGFVYCMGLRQFSNSLKSILSNPHISRGKGIVRHLHWQFIKAFNQFPRELVISQSRIIAAHKRCGVSALIHSQELYNYNNMKLLQLLLREGGTFLDVGANIGSYSLLASEQEDAKVFAFEPHPETFRLLQKNVELNSRKNVNCFNVALGQIEGKLFLTDNPGSTTNHIEHDGNDQAIEVQCARGDMICTSYNIQPQYIKVDVEGFEYDVLAGFGKYLKSIDLVMVEMNGLSDQRSRGRRAIHTLLNANGFSGPWQCDADKRRLCHSDRDTIEDSLYLSSHGSLVLAQNGFI